MRTALIRRGAWGPVFWMSATASTQINDKSDKMAGFLEKDDATAAETTGTNFAYLPLTTSTVECIRLKSGLTGYCRPEQS